MTAIFRPSFRAKAMTRRRVADAARRVGLAAGTKASVSAAAVIGTKSQFPLRPSSNPKPARKPSWPTSPANAARARMQPNRRIRDAATGRNGQRSRAAMNARSARGAMTGPTVTIARIRTTVTVQWVSARTCQPSCASPARSELQFYARYEDGPETGPFCCRAMKPLRSAAKAGSRRGGSAPCPRRWRSTR